MSTLLYERDVTLQPSDLEGRLTLSRPPSRPRAAGVHVSGILQAIAAEVGWLKPGERDEDTYPMRWAMGVAWEEFWFSMKPMALWQPGEATKDGVSGNCDGITEWDAEAGGSVIEETKCTELKIRTWAELEAEKKIWMHQLRAYCYLYGIDTTRLVPNYYRGDWRGSGPLVREYLVRWSEKEIDDTWRMLLKWKHKATPEPGPMAGTTA
jgi:hypothetical protein